jgi:hypothetical protein
MIDPSRLVGVTVGGLMLGLIGAALGAGLVAAAELHWTAPAGCPSEPVVRGRLQALLGDDVLRPDVVARAEVSRHEGGWILQLSLRTADRSSTQHMVSDECETLADAVALVVATFADPLTASARVVGRSPAVPERTEPVLEVVPSAPPPVASPRADGSPPALRRPLADPRGPRPPDRWGLRVGVVAGRATQPDLDVGPEVALSWQRGIVRLAIGALGLAPRRQAVRERDGVVLRQWMVAGGLQAGVVVPLTPWLELPLSVGVEVGPLVARGEGIDRPRTVASPWLAALGSAHFVWRPGPRWGIWVGVVGVAGVLLPQFTVAGAPPSIAGPGGLRGSLGVEWRWGRDHQIGPRWPLRG